MDSGCELVTAIDELVLSHNCLNVLENLLPLVLEPDEVALDFGLMIFAWLHVYIAQLSHYPFNYGHKLVF